MPKQYLQQNVLTAAKERISQTFDDFERVYVSFSAGKDSTVMLGLVADEARRRGRRIGVLFVDLEGQYKLTIDHARRTFDELADIADPYWVCLPLHLRNAVSVYDPFWVCWDDTQQHLWIRPKPEGVIGDAGYFPFFRPGMEFEEFVPLFGEWYSQGKPTACFVGIRANESLNRYRTIASRTKGKHKDYQWTTKVSPNVCNIYPIYDWTTEDIWRWHALTGAKHNELYDLMYKAGLSIHQMRICQPYGDDQRKGLWLFHLIEPETWAKIVCRVNGANGGALYVQDTGNITGYRTIKKPDGHTWQSFAKLLVESMPPKTKEHYQTKIFVFKQFWESRGYPNGIPDEMDINLEAKRSVPSWRRICKSLLRNDFWCKGLSFAQHKSRAYEAYVERIKKKMASAESV